MPDSHWLHRNKRVTDFKHTTYHRRSGITPCPEEYIQFMQYRNVSTIFRQALNLDVSLIKASRVFFFLVILALLFTAY